MPPNQRLILTRHDTVGLGYTPYSVYTQTESSSRTDIVLAVRRYAL
jgi:hypothetical protein